MMKPYLVDVPVALVFFARPECFSQVFEKVKEARPSKIFLIQDGAREGRPNDLNGIKKCREIAENIDWECEVYKNYSNENLGCGKRVSSGISWAFGYVDRLIILEDDTVPSISWFSFCAELLERYKSDERVGMITGVNHLGKYTIPTGDSYFFATCGSIAGWATWKRVWNDYDYDCSFADEEYYLRQMYNNIYPRHAAKEIIKKVKQIRKNVLSDNNVKRSSWSGPFGYISILQSRLIIVPIINLITNVGVNEGATNGGVTKAIIPKKLQTIFDAPSFEFYQSLIHPKYVIENKDYNDELNKVMNGGSFIGRKLRKIEVYVRILLVKYLKVLK